MRVSTGLLAAALGLAACNKSEPPATASIPPLMEGWGEATPLGGRGVLTYDLTVAPADLARLTATALQEIWIPAELTVSGRPVGPVGLRFKGSDGTLAVCFENGKQICAKASFKIKFDYVDPSKRFEGFTRLNFHSMLGDASQLRERLATEMWRRMNVIGPRAAHAYLTLNGEVRGLFSTVEDLDDAFTKDRWREQGSGNLYEEVWPNEVDVEHYNTGLKTNRAMPNHQRITAFAEALFKAKQPAELTSAVSEFLDVDQVMRYMAVDQAINNYDGVTAFYCNRMGQECTNHNFLLYQHPNNKFLLVPWDLSQSFFLRTIFAAVPRWETKPVDCGQRYLVEGETPVAAPGCDLVFQGLQNTGRASYERALDQTLAVWDVAALHRLIDDWSTEILPAVARDPNGPGIFAWRSAVESLKISVGYLRERIEALRAGRDLSPAGLKAPGVTTFDDMAGLDFLLGATADHNSASGSVLDLGTTGALVGAKDVLLKFEFSNETRGEVAEAGAWLSLRLPMHGGAVSLEGAQSIRVKMAADNIRNVRIELDGPGYGQGEDVGRYGWDVTVARTAREFSLPLDQLKIPPDSEDPPVSATDLRKRITGIIITPQSRDKNDKGLLPRGASEAGFLRLDDFVIE